MIKLFKSSFKKPGFNLFEKLFVNYYWILVIGGLLYITAGITWFDPTFYPFVILVIFIYEYRTIKLNIFDFLWIVTIVWYALTWIANEYPYKSELIIRCLSEQISYTLCYWIVRFNKKLNAQEIVKSALFPLFVTSIIGIYFYFYPPAWYLKNTRAFFTDFEEYEFLRLRSIFIDSYTISYFLGISIIYIIFKLARRHSDSNKLLYILLGIYLITLFLTIQRSIIAAVVVSVIISLIYSFIYGNIKYLTTTSIIVVICIFATGILFDRMDYQGQEYYLSKITSITDDSSETIENRLFFNKQNYEYNLIGDGVGRHNLYSELYNPGTSLRDGEYNKIIVEQGYIGLSFFIIIILLSIFKCLSNFKYLSYELSIIILLLICMIGANPLSTFDKHPIIYWLVLGQISNYNRK